MSTTPTCGLGAPAGSGPCTGTISPSQAGKGVFDGLSTVPVVQSLLAAAVILAAVIFAVWIVRKVATFFQTRSGYVGGEPGTMEYDDNFWRDVGRQANASRPDADFGDVEDDTEDDSDLSMLDSDEFLRLESDA